MGFGAQGKQEMPVSHLTFAECSEIFPEEEKMEANPGQKQAMLEDLYLPAASSGWPGASAVGWVSTHWKVPCPGIYLLLESEFSLRLKSRNAHQDTHGV